jgi:YggT family protein
MMVRRHPDEEVVVREPAPASRAVSKLAQIVWFIVGLIVTLLVIRILLALAGANLDNEFASFIYSLSDPLVSPFRGLLRIGEFQAGIARFEVETFVAMIVYVLAGSLLVRAIDLARP